MASDRKAFSHSRLQTLSDCPRRYGFRYVEGLKEAFQTIEAFLGTMVHEVVQWAYVEREARAEPDAGQAVDRYHDAWRQRIGPGVRVVVEGRAAGQYEAEGEEMIRRHHATTFAEDRLETLAIEPRIDLVIGENAYMGFIDRLARGGDGVLHVIDYKTSRSMPKDAASAGLQGRGYGVAVLEKHGGVEVSVRYEYLRQGRAIEEMLPRARIAEVTSAIGARIEAALAAERAGDFPARPGPLCRWCGFRESCDASPFRGGSTGPPGRAGTNATPGDRPVASAEGAPLLPLPRPPISVAAPPAAPSGVVTGGDPLAASRTSPPRSSGLPSSRAPSGHAPVPGAALLGMCPLCGHALARRTGSRGDMIACSRYPECRHSRKI